MLYQTMSILSDDKSKSLLINLIAYRIAGHLSFRIDVDFDLKNSEAWQEFSTVCSAAGPSEIAVGGFLGQLKHFDFFMAGTVTRRIALVLRIFYLDGNTF